MTPAAQAEILAMAGVTADELGQDLRRRWEDWARMQPDAAEHPSWTRPWHLLDERDREIDRQMAAAAFCAGWVAARKAYRP